MEVVLASAWLRKLEWAGSRCWMRMNAIPVFAGSALRSCVNASSPPADAPMPTTGNDGLSVCAASRAAGRGRRRRSVPDDFALDWPMGPPRLTLESWSAVPLLGLLTRGWDRRNLPYARQRPACQRQGGLDCQG